LGDYIDGSTSRHFSDHIESVTNDPLGVLDIIRDRVTTHGDVALLGNHDDFWVGTAKHRALDYQTWRLNGGSQTWRTIGIHAIAFPAVSEALNQEPLKPYTTFLEQLPVRWENDGILAVHAGVDWDVDLNQQDRNDQMWIREDYYYQDHDPAKGWHRNDLGKVIVTGHTPAQMLQRNGLGYLKMQVDDQDVPRYLIDSGSHSGAYDGGIFGLTLDVAGTVLQKKRVVKGVLYDGDQPLTEAMVRN